MRVPTMEEAFAYAGRTLSCPLEASRRIERLYCHHQVAECPEHRARLMRLIHEIAEQFPGADPLRRRETP